MDQFNPNFFVALAFVGILGYLLGDTHGCLVGLCIYLGTCLILAAIP